jgi:hypothetical protein
MDEKISPGLVKLFSQNEKHHLDLWAEHQALLHVLNNSLPFLPPEVRAEFVNYKQLKAKILEDYLLSLEKKFPRFAADLDEDRPAFPPSDTDNPLKPD